MRILITGNKGQLGRDTSDVLSPDHEVVGVDLPEFDISNLSLVRELVERFRPDATINCAAFTQVDACETEKELAWSANVTGPKNLATCVEKYGGQLIHISTDYVFDGRKTVPKPYVETDETRPVSVYGRTKLEGEKAVGQATERHVILRTAWLYGINGHNFLKTMLKLAMNHPERAVKVVNDQFGSPTWSYRLALQIKEILFSGGKGIYHATGEGYCTWYAFAKKFLEKLEVPHFIEPCTTQEYPTPAARPENAILENRRLKTAGMNVMKDWEEDLDAFVAEFHHNLTTEVGRVTP